MLQGIDEVSPIISHAKYQHTKQNSPIKALKHKNIWKMLKVLPILQQKTYTTYIKNKNKKIKKNKKNPYIKKIKVGAFHEFAHPLQ